MNFPILLSILLCPLIGLGFVLLTPSRFPNTIRTVSLLFSTLALYFTFLLLQRFDPNLGALQFTERIPWIPSLKIDLSLGVDGLSITMILLTSIILFCGVICSWSVQQRVKSFFANLLFLVTGVYGVFMSTNLFFFFLFYEVAVLPMYLLILLWGSTNKEYAAMKLTLYLLFGSALLFVAFLILYTMPQSNTFDLWHIQSVANFTLFQEILLYGLVFFGFGVLCGLFPFHVWSPDGHVAAPTAASMMHAGVLMKLGAYGILRIGFLLFPQGALWWSPITAILGLCGVIYGAFVATQQRDIKYMIGFSSVSHMGLVILGISAMNSQSLEGAVFQMFSHGIMTALFFASIGFIYDQTHNRKMDELGGLARVVPRISIFFIIAGLVGMGLPGFSGFVAELLILLGTVQTFPILGYTALLSLLITAYYILTCLQKTFFGPVNPKYSHIRDVDWWQMIPRTILVLTLLFFGIYPNVFLNWIRSSTVSLLQG